MASLLGRISQHWRRSLSIAPRYVTTNTRVPNRTNVSRSAGTRTSTGLILHRSHSSQDYTQGLVGLLALSTCSFAYSENQALKEPPDVRDKQSIQPESQDLINWSGTHSISTNRYFTPESEAELIQIVQQAHEKKQKLRPVGSALSPNGIGFAAGGMVNLIHMDKILNVDRDTKRITVQAGASVSKVVEELRKYELTLQNFASITEQQIGGLIQVGAHGTGAKIPPVDEQVVGLKVVTPGAGVLNLTADDDDPSLFQVARTAMGMVGIVSEVTLQCVPMHRLVEQTIVMSPREVMQHHEELMRENRHLRYMWIPYTDTVVVVTCNPVDDNMRIQQTQFSEAERVADAKNLLMSHKRCALTKEEVDGLSFVTVRDELLALDPLNVEWIRKVNKTEASYWRKSQGTRIDWSDRILQFDCGGQQWVSEVAFPVPKDSQEHVDVKYVCNLLDTIEKEKVPAPAPIEQRWSAPSHSPMSPASEKPERDLGSVYSWVGIIMYLPDAEVDSKSRENITESFRRYKRICEDQLWPDVRAVEHWAKIEMPQTPEEKAKLQMRTYQKYPVQAFNAICAILDPHGVLRNDLMDTILGKDGSM
ncbi:L-galactono-1,4-lactone dehydrogenase, mitochondrial [Gracilariopsis chorda]|uniref:L-galactono-1,4-lactone dehydrogenase, mitochondrial n=1 Tax=Gracilariopsis chorda TaxID=448386 RepID=A0A2V3IUB3_9FLOR|nr:L-galactono-1,4-lactone dehydrogenase, mitochondrial [Gracilariopsis chorda]|eukprot:PXF44710.1 L-galactono-1,4-lactone dehydrogenase, mitochondrial [Gracilariopsis chorda]